MLQGDLIRSIFLPFYLQVIYYKKIDFKKHLRLVFIQLLGLISSFLLIVSLERYLRSIENLKIEEILVILIFFIASYIFFLYLSIFDSLCYSIPTNVVKLFLMFVGFSNLFVVSVRFFSFQLSGDLIFKNVELGQVDNLLIGLIFWAVTYILVKVSKEKGLGEGDVDIMGIVGLSLGWPYSLISIFFTLLTGGVFSLILAMLVKKFRDVLVPLVPFIFLGFLIVIGFGEDFINFVWLT